ncbi:hypothetical protein AAKU52_001939 [Pedobacter sp. CG_S7]|uniref:hypothetical protein n=1 Tax=Pedobacter sp. CG_S7 TaxID=3143930 RepID=UPI003396B789
MKRTLLLLIIIINSSLSFSQNQAKKPVVISPESLIGTWKLVYSKVTTGKKTEITYPVKDQEMIKIFSGHHFAFFKHDVKKGKIDTPVFSSGAGTYTISGDVYKEHLSYCNYREWENMDFEFTISLKKDSLIQKGIERIESLNVDQEIIEIYKRITE